MIRRIWLIAAVTLLAAACGDDDDAAARTTLASSTTAPATSAAPVNSSSTTVAVVTTPPPATTAVATTVGNSTTAVASCAAPPTFDASSPLRDQFVSYLVVCGFTQSESACLYDHLDFDDPAVLAGDADAMLPAFRACDIDASRMAEIGRA
jgi:hypothetical protein